MPLSLNHCSYKLQRVNSFLRGSVDCIISKVQTLSFPEKLGSTVASRIERPAQMIGEPCLDPAGWSAKLTRSATALGAKINIKIGKPAYNVLCSFNTLQRFFRLANDNSFSHSNITQIQLNFWSSFLLHTHLISKPGVDMVMTMLICKIIGRQGCQTGQHATQISWSSELSTRHGLERHPH